MKNLKYFVLIILISVLSLSVFYVIKDYRVRNDTRRQQLAYIALLTETTSAKQANLSCQQTNLQHRDDYPGILSGKSIDELKKLIQEQKASC